MEYDDVTKQVEPFSIKFSMFTSDNIKKISVKKISTSLTFDNLGYPLPGGLYDSALGPLNEKSDPCATCFKNIYNCPGHFGYIEIPVNVINPLFYSSIRLILRICCTSCSMLQLPSNIKHILSLQMKLLDNGFVTEAQELANYIGILVEELEDKNENEIKNINENSFSNVYLKKYVKLAKSGSVLYSNNKNIEAIRNSFVNNIIKPILIKGGQKCLFCKEKIKKITTSYQKIMICDSENKSELRMIMPDELQKILRKIWTCNYETLQNLIPVLKDIEEEFPTDIMFMNVVPVVPPIVRPINYVGDRMAEHPQTILYKLIIETSLVIRTIIKVLKTNDNLKLLTDESRVVFNQQAGKTSLEKFHLAWQELQAHIDHIMNKEVPRSSTNTCDGIKQIIEKKTGIIRQHMMGKRVNYAARSVITPDPNLNINEIGVPEIFAKKLTYPVFVTAWNVEKLREMIINGPNQYPGAVMIENENGSSIILSQDMNVRKIMAKRLLIPDKKLKQPFKGVKIVHRHLLTGDVLLLNRQPTLHKPSIMAHTARILKGEKTLRLHYANCKAYNADFDGDEMNAHFPQNELARSEAYNIVNVCNQYLVPKDGTPLSGLIQDHMIAGVKLSIRGKFFTKNDYFQLVYIGLNHKLGHLILLPPAILKPVQLWSGKQVISTILINNIPKDKPLINLTSVAKISSKAWNVLNRKDKQWKAGGTPFKNDLEMGEAEVIIRQGELLCGVLDKMHYGATQYGLIHCVYELYGGKYSNILLSAFAKLFTAFLQREGFTLGVEDILVVKKADEIRKQYVAQCRSIGKEVAARTVGMSKHDDYNDVKKKIEESYVNNPKFRMVIDRQYKTILDRFTNNINKTCIPAGLISKFPHNNLQLMVQSGAKGSMVNCMQISCLLGQIELEGKRPPIMISGRTLPSFPPYETEPRSGGFIDGRFMTGIQPQEFFFHCMAGREGLIDTAVKTSRSGYLQRCLVKHLEGLTVGYDLTVRDSDNSVIQFFYGEDGMDIGKMQFLKKNQLKFLEENMNIILDSERQKVLNNSENSEIIKYKKAVHSWKKKFGSPIKKIFNRQSLKTNERKLPCPDPVVSRYQPDCYPGVINEYLEDLIHEYALNKKVNGSKYFSKRNFSNTIKIKAIETICPPGEPVGMLAAQSIGEPSTQMTLNTFHFAGRGEMNVTLGIPRLREILMCASKDIKTPNMEIPVKPEVQTHIIKKMCKKFTRVTVSNVLEKIHLRKNLNILNRTQTYKIKFYFLPENLYKGEYYIKPKHILKYMEKHFFINMFEAFKKAANIRVNVISVKENTTKKGKTTELEENSIKLNDAESSDSEVENEESKFKRKKFEDSESDAEMSEGELNNNIDEKTEENDTNKENSNFDHLHCSNVINSLRFTSNYSYDVKNKRWCEITFDLPFSFKNIDVAVILKEIVIKSVIWQTPNIRRAITYLDKKGCTVLRTEGININEMFKYIDIFDLNKLYTNDIHSMAKTYGIEAAARVITREIRDVFDVYGITVDPRHLSLVADYMTYDGLFQPLSRKGMEDGASPIQQMSFESSLTFLRNAIIQGKVDMIKTPSSCLFVGYPCRSGTGIFELVNDIKNK